MFAIASLVRCCCACEVDWNVQPVAFTPAAVLPSSTGLHAQVVEHLSRLVPEIAAAEAAAAGTGGNRVFGRLFSKATAAVAAPSPSQAPSPGRPSLSTQRSLQSPVR